MRVLGLGDRPSTSRSRRRPGRRLLRAGRAACAATPSTARSPAAATSGSSTRPPEGEAAARRRALRLRRRPGSGRARRRRRSSTRSRSSSRTCTSPSGATSDRRPDQRDLREPTRKGAHDHEPHLKVWRQDGADRRGRFETYDATDINEDMSFLEMLDVVNERLIAEGHEPIAFDSDCREGICGTCWPDDQRPGPRPPEGHRHLPAAHAQVPRRRRDHHRAVAGRRLPGHAGPDGRPRRVRPHHRGRRLHLGQHRRRRPTPTSIPVPKDAADAAMDAAACIGCGACVAACPNSAGAAVHRRPRSPTSTCCPRARPSAGAAPRRWSRRWRSSSGRAPTTASARKRARRRSRIDFIAYMNRDYIKAKVKNRKLIGQRK